MSKGNVNDFLKALFAREGGAFIGIINSHGFIGKYQFGEPALTDLGYYKPADNDSPYGHIGHKFKYMWPGAWTGLDGATSMDVFLASDDIQDRAAKRWIALLCKELHRHKLERFEGKNVGGVDVTESGIIAALHLKGLGNKKNPGVLAFFSSNGAEDGVDANGTRLSSYMKKFSDYDLGCCERAAVTVVDRNHEPIAGLKLKVHAKGKEVYSGTTDAKGKTKVFKKFCVGDELKVFVEKLEGGFKEVASFVAESTPMSIGLISPKILADMVFEKHQAAPGAHEYKGIHKAKHHRVHHHRHPHQTSGLVRDQHGHPASVLPAANPPPPVADKIDSLQKILINNTHYGKHGAVIDGLSAVKKCRAGKEICTAKKNPTLSTGQCYKYVKIALQASGFVDEYLSGVAPKDSANNALKRQGYTNLLDNPGPNGPLQSPMDAPVGAVIVYGVTDKSSYGHIEVRVDDKGTPKVASDYLSDHARTEVPGQGKSMRGRNRFVLGIWVKD
jgi:hypothetical protein